MMRQPTTTAVAYAWWRAALRDPSTPRHDGEPQAGFYQTRMVRGGPFVAVRIWLEQETDENGELVADEKLRAELNGERRDPAAIWTFCRPISRAAYDALAGLKSTVPFMAATRAAIDITETAIGPRKNTHG